MSVQTVIVNGRDDWEKGLLESIHKKVGIIINILDASFIERLGELITRFSNGDIKKLILSCGDLTDDRIDIIASFEPKSLSFKSVADDIDSLYNLLLKLPNLVELDIDMMYSHSTDEYDLFQLLFHSENIYFTNMEMFSFKGYIVPCGDLSRYGLIRSEKLKVIKDIRMDFSRMDDVQATWDIFKSKQVVDFHPTFRNRPISSSNFIKLDMRSIKATSLSFDYILFDEISSKHLLDGILASENDRGYPVERLVFGLQTSGISNGAQEDRVTTLFTDFIKKHSLVSSQRFIIATDFLLSVEKQNEIQDTISFVRSNKLRMAEMIMGSDHIRATRGYDVQRKLAELTLQLDQLDN